MSEQSNRPDPIAGMAEPPDDGLAPEERTLPEEDATPEEYEPADPDPEAIVDGGSDAVVDPDAGYPRDVDEDTPSFPDPGDGT